MENVNDEIDSDTENIIITISVLLYIEIIQTDETPQNFNLYERQNIQQKKKDYHEINAVLISHLFFH